MDITRFYFINSSLYDLLPQEEVDFLNRVKVVRKYPKGTDVYMEGAFPKGIYILDKGKLKIYQKTFEGLQQIVNIHIAGEIVGYRPLLCDERYPVTATTLEDAEVSFISKKHFLQALSKSVIFSNALLKFLSYEFTVWVNTISNLKQLTVKERLLMNLLILIEKYRAGKTWPVEITLSRADLAALIGTSSETLARLLKVLKDDKYIASKGRTIVVNGPAQATKMRRALRGLF